MLYSVSVISKFSLPFVRFLARDKTFVWKSNCKSIKQMNPVTKSAKYKLRCFLEKYFIFSRRYDQILWRTMYVLEMIDNIRFWNTWFSNWIAVFAVVLLHFFLPSFDIRWIYLFQALNGYQKLSRRVFQNSTALQHLCRFWLINETENFISATKIKGL